MMGRVILEIPKLNLLVSNFLCAVWPKSLSAQPHSVPGLFDTLEAGGPQVTIITAQADGYSAELERTFFIGHVPEEATAPFDAFMEARALAYELIRPGVAAAEVDEKVLRVLKDRGYGDRILHRTGHGFGITGHEPPWLALGSDEILEKNMVVSIEPGIYIPETGGFRHSDTVLVTADGCVSLTSGPQELEDLILPA
jgi:Xaa-Pro dipeptidase